MATLKDVAREAGLTVGTVSRILNNRGYISSNAREKVEEAMKKLNYRPNEVARSLHGKSTNTIGLIVPHIKHPYFAETISNLENQAYKKGYKILLCNSQSIREKEKEYIDICTGNRAAGLILCSGTVDTKMFEQGELAAQKLIACGCKNLLHIGTIGTVHMPADMRTEGFREVCQRQGIAFVELSTEEEQYNNMEYDELLESVLRKYPKTDGMFLSSDVMAAQALQICRKLGISVPDQMKIIGFDDVNIASLTTPQLTTIHQPVKEMAEIAVNLLHDAVSGKLVPKRTVLPVCLIERETT